MGVTVVGLHVHHGLMPEADAWQRMLEARSRQWARRGLPVALVVHRLEGRPPPGASVEAWARRERYAALAAMASEQGCTVVWLAHHRRDQAETLLLQALRGGGPRGLAGMPREVDRAGVRWVRPWLAQPREAIEAYVARYRLHHVDDVSNADPRWARARLRQWVWPTLLTAFPEAESALAAAASQAAEVDACARTLAGQDLTAAWSDERALRVDMLPPPDGARGRQALRHGLRTLCGRGVPDSLIDRLSLELRASRVARWPAPGGELRLYDGLLRFAPITAAAEANRIVECVLDLRRPGRHRLPGGAGELIVTRVRCEGVALERLAQVQVRIRAGGEHFQLQPRATARSLKKQYQARRVPPWQRGGPMLVVDGRTLFVPGLGVDAREWAAPGAPQARLTWVPAGTAQALR